MCQPCHAALIVLRASRHAALKRSAQPSGWCLFHSAPPFQLAKAGPRFQQSQLKGYLFLAAWLL
eukprot:357003-Chlamydomonas_euryale.AAC.5